MSEICAHCGTPDCEICSIQIDYFDSQPDEKTRAQELIDNAAESDSSKCDDCQNEFELLFHIRPDLDKPVTPDLLSLLGQRCVECLIKKFPSFADEIRESARIAHNYLVEHMSADEWEELYGEE